MRMTPVALVAGLTLLLGGCFSNSASDSAQAPPPPPPPPSSDLTAFRALYVPRNGVVPTPNDIFFSGSTDGTLNLPATPFNPLVSSLNALDGYSTTATITARFSEQIDAATLEPFNALAPSPTANIFVLNATAQTPLIPGVHFTAGLEQTVTSAGTTLEIRPVVPLAPKSTYAVIVTAGIRNMAGEPAEADAAFEAIRDAHLAGQSLSDPLLENIRVNAVGPLLDAAQNLLNVPGEAVIAAWSVSTQSISDVLDAVEAAAVAQSVTVTPTPVATTANLGGAGAATLHNGTLELPYYLSRSAPLSAFWQGAGGSHLTRFNPMPVPTQTLTVPMVVTIPIPGTVVPGLGTVPPMPGTGWPVVIYQHGITTDRSTVVALADAFALAGFVVASIDLPLHGIRATNAQGQLNPLFGLFGQANLEPHFNLDVFIDTGPAAGTPGSDGIIDNSAFLFVNLSSPLTLRDNLRQGVSNLIALAKSLPTIDLNGDSAPDLDGSRVHFMGWSLGGIVGTSYLAVNNDAIAASLFAPGGMLTNLILESQSFGPLIIGLLEAQGLQQGTALFNEFIRNIQTIVDSGDPINYAAAAGANHPIHMLEVLGDATVPNSATDFLARVMGLAAVDMTTSDPGGVSGIVRLTEGDHASIASPAASPAAFAEAQRQTSTYLASNGTTILITNTTIIQPAP